MIVIASIHQPSTSTFELFDKLLLLASGRVCYNGSISSIRPYLEAHGIPMPLYINPAEFLLDLTSSDFALDGSVAQSRVEKLQYNWESSAESSSLTATIAALTKENAKPKSLSESKARASFLTVVLALLHRSFIKSYRDVVAYGIRFAMYIGQFPRNLQRDLPNTYRPCHYDGDRLASSANDSEFNPAIYQCHRKSCLEIDLPAIDLSHSSSARHSCHSWPLPTYLPFLRTAQLL